MVENEGNLNNTFSLRPIPSTPRKAIVTILVILIAAIALSPWYPGGDDGFQPRYRTVVERETTTDVEDHVLDHVEGLDLTNITGIGRYWTGDGLVNDPSGSERGVFPYLIDRLSLDMFIGTTVALRRSGAQVQRDVVYMGECRQVGSLVMVPDPARGIVWLPTVGDIALSDHNGSSDFFDPGGLMDEDGNYTLATAFIVSQTLEFYHSRPGGGFESSTQQFMVLDGDLRVRALCVSQGDTTFFSRSTSSRWRPIGWSP